MAHLRRWPVLVVLAGGLLTGASYAQYTTTAFDMGHPAIAYGRTPATDRVEALNARLASGATQLQFENGTGYLRALLNALEIPVESQIALFSKTSLQSRLISPRNPRTIFFNDSIAVAWMRGGFIEVASHDRRDGGVFYTLGQVWSPSPQLQRDNKCLSCHYSLTTEGVPGFIARSVATAAGGDPMPWLANYITDHRSPLEERWAGWYVTGQTGRIHHLGNMAIADNRAQDLSVAAANLNLTDVGNRFDAGNYLSPYSDVVALLVFEHQARMMNLLTRMRYESEVLAHESKTGVQAASALRPLVVELVDYMLFVDEAPLSPIRGSSGFAEKFSARGPRDARGRSLRDLDLQRRLLRYPCSYMIYTDAFDALPVDVKQAIYARMSEVLSGRERAAKYARLSAADRQAVVEILRETKKDLPAAFAR